MIFTSAGELSVAGAAVLPPHAVRTNTAVRTNNNGRMNMRIRLLLLNLDFAADCWGPPSDQAVLERGDECFRQQRHGGQQQHPRENTVGVEVVFGAVDQLPDSLGCAKELAYDRSDQGQAEADVKARDDPAERRGNDHLGGQPSIVSAEDACVGDQVAFDFTDALERVEEDDEEDEDRRGRNLGANVQPERDGEQSSQDHPRYRVRGFDVDREDVGQEPVPAQQHADHHAQHRADDEAEDRLLHRYQHLLPERTQRGFLGDPDPQLLGYPGGLTEEELVDDADAGRQLPAAEHDDRDQHAQPIDVELAPASRANTLGRKVRDWGGGSWRADGL